MATAIQLDAVDRPHPRRIRSRGIARTQTTPLTSVSGVASLRAILDRWKPYSVEEGKKKACACPTCVELRADAFHCSDCGYRGTPLVHPCHCGGSEFASSAAAQTANLSGADLTAFLETNGIASLTPFLCSVHESTCSHGGVECPVCIDADEGRWTEAKDNRHPWTMIRDLRRALTRVERSLRPRDTELCKIEAALNRPNRDYFGECEHCDCAGCRALREAGWACASCGYTGAPFIWSCECREVRAGNIEAYDDLLARLDAGEPNSKALRLSTYTRQDLLEMRATEHALPDTRCEIGQRDCCHGACCCPTCGDVGTGRGVEHEVAAFMPMIREIRAVLASARTQQ